MSKNINTRRTLPFVSLLLCLLLLLLLFPASQAPAAEQGVTYYHVLASVSGGHGWLYPNLQEVKKNQNAMIYIFPESGYRIASIRDNFMPKPISNPYVITRVRRNHYITVKFEKTEYNVSASVSGGHGSVSPTSQTVKPGGTATIDITPDTGYHIEKIMDNDQVKPVADPYVIDDVSKNHDVVVSFAKDTFTVNASVSGGNGTVDPATQTVSYGGTAEIDITPNPGYSIASITDNGTPEPIADPYLITGVSENHNVVVTFSAGQHTVRASVKGGHGSVDPEEQTVAYNGTAAIDITPETGYHIQTITDNGEFQTPATPYVITNVTADHDVVVTFAVNTYSVNASVSGGNGSVDPAAQTVAYGDTAQIDITPNTGYHIDGITDNGTPATITDPYIIDDVTADHTVVVSFAQNQYTVDASVSGGNGTVAPLSQSVTHGGTASITITPAGGYHTATITDNGVSMPIAEPYVINNVSSDHTVIVTFASTNYNVAATVAGGNGSVVPEFQSVAAGGSASININPDTGYHIASVVDNGVPQAAASPYVINPVNEDHSVVAVFAADEYTVDALCYGDGSVDPSTQTVLNGGTASIDINVDPGNHIAAILDNGVSMPVANPYVITNVQEEHTVRVFVLRDIYDVNAVAGDPNGTVDPATQEVVYGDNASIDIIPNAGYQTNSIVDNMISKPIADPYVIDGVSVDHNVVVGFTQKQYTVDASVAGGGGSVNPGTQTVLHGGTASITITPDAGKHIDTISDNGQFVTVSNPYVITGVAADHDVVITFADDQFNVTASVAGGNGTVNPAAQVVDYGHTAAVDIVPATGYHIASILDNGVPMPVDDPYLLENVQLDHNVVVSFAQDQYTVDASVSGGNGAVNPTTQTSIYGANAVVEIDPDPGYKTEYILDNGEFKETANPYVITDVGSNHDVVVAFEASDTPDWYLAEGSTAYGFSTYISIENPTTENLNADITYMLTGGSTMDQQIGLPALSQVTVDPSSVVGEADFSTTVECVQGDSIAVDRTMIWTGPGAPSPEGHNSIGVTSPEEQWYMPEGSSNWGFETWTLVQNPNDEDAQVNVTYMIEDVGPKNFTRTVPAHSRVTYSMDADIGVADASIRVTSEVPVIAERSTYRNNRREGQCSIGSNVSAGAYYLAEGTTAWGFTTYVLVQNPNDTVANVTVTYMTPVGPRVQPSFAMPPNSRKTIRVNDVADVSNIDLSTQVDSDVPIVAERSMYWGAGTPLGEACHDSIGLPSPHEVFYLPDGQTSQGRETWTLVQNPNDSGVEVGIVYLLAGDKGQVSFVTTVPAGSRRTFNMADHVTSDRASVLVTCLTDGKKILAERSMYWNSRGAGTDTVGGYSD